MKRISAVILIIAMLICTIFLSASCSKKDENPRRSVAETPPYAYTSRDITLPDDIFAARQSEVFDGRIYALCYEYTDVENEYMQVLYSFDTNGENLKKEDIPQNCTYYHISELGKIYITSQYDSETGGFNCIYYEYSPDGDFVREKDLTESGLFDRMVSSAACDSDGNVYLIVNESLIVYSQNFEDITEITHDQRIIGLTSSGNRVIAKYAGNTGFGCGYGYVNTDEKNITPIALPESIASERTYEVHLYLSDVSEGYDFYFCTSVGIYGFNEYENESEAVLLVSRAESNLLGNTSNAFAILSPEKMVYFYNDYFSGKVTPSFLEKPADGKGQERYIINLTFFSRGEFELQGAVSNFNRTNRKYKIILTDYWKYNTGEDMNAGQKMLDNDIIAGNVPDIIYSQRYDNIENYIEKGLFCDLYPFFDADSDLSKDDLLNCVRTPFELDGKLYNVCLKFSIQTIIGKSSLIGDKAGWSVSEMIDFAKSVPEDKLLMTGLTKNSMKNLLFKLGFDTFIDYKKAVCSFDSAEFIEVLEYIKSIPDTLDASLYDSPEKEHISYQNGNIILAEYSLNPDRLFQCKFLFNSEDLTVKGYPSASGNGSVVSVGDCFAITEDSPVKEGAWEFIKYLFSDEIQEYLVNYSTTPSTSKGFNMAAERAKNLGYYFSYGGGAAIHPIPNTLTVEFYEQNYGKGQYITLTDEDMEMLTGLVDSADVSYQKDSTVKTILDEEINIFLNGKRSAEETAKIIQSRVSLYISEKY